MKFTKWQGCGNDFVVVDFLDKEPMDFARCVIGISASVRTV